MQTHPTSHRAGQQSSLRLALAALLAGLLLAQPLLADSDPVADSEASDESVSDASDASDAADASADSESEEGVASESRTMDILNKSFDVVALRPAQALMAGVGAVLFVPVAILASPGGRESIEEALDRFVMIPAETAFQRPLGEF